MQNFPPFDTPQSWPAFLAVAVISFFLKDGLVALGNLILGRKKPAAEVGESQARSTKTLAEARQIDVQSNKTAADTILEMVTTLRNSETALRDSERRAAEVSEEKDRYKARVAYYERKERRRLSAQAQQPRVLFVEDTDEHRELLMVQFRNAPFRAEFARDGVDGLEQYHDAISLGFPFKLLVIDYSMPGMSGTELVEEVRQSGDQQTMIVFYTAFPSHVVADDISRLKVLGYVTKGDDPTALEVAIQKALGIKGEASS
jgi:CheY-like chemotaxis protein